MFSVHSTPEKLENATITDHFRFVFEEIRSGSSRNISNMRDSVSSGYPNTEKRVETTTRSGVFLTKFMAIADETQSRVFDTSSQSKLKLRSKRRIKS